MADRDAQLCGHHEHDDEGRHGAPHEHAAAHGGHGPAHAHSIGEHRKESRGKLITVLVITAVFMVIEVFAGFYTGSLALIAEAGHMLNDVAAQLLAFFALWFASRPPDPNRTYGYYRTEILAGLINGVALVGISIFIIYEAWQRLAHPPEIMSGPVIVVAALGLVVNLYAVRVLHSVADHSLNMKAAYLEVFSDLMSSVGVLIGAIVIYFMKWYVADPIISMVIGIWILPRTWRLLAECTNILMEGTPRHIDLDKLRDALIQVNGVLDVHDIHVWTITSGLDAMSGHVCVKRDQPAERVLSEVTRIAQEEFGIHHTTIQLEPCDP